MMRRCFLTVVSFVVALITLSSCLGDNDYTYYDDAAITDFSLGTLNRYYTVTASDGSDSTYKKTLSCSSYTFNIDQVNNKIWNADSLPKEIDATKVICSMSTKNSGSVYILNLTEDTLTYFSSSDSIDFSSPRKFVVYSTSGDAYRTYEVSVNVHQEDGDTCIWSQVTSGNSTLAGLTDMKALGDGEYLYLFANDGDETKLFTTSIDDGATWTEIDTDPALPVGSSKSTIMQNGVFFTYGDGEVLRSEDAVTWEVAGNADLKQLVGASTVNLYALSSDGNLVSSADEGASWTVETLDDEASLLPTEDISFACREMTTNTNTDKLVLIGNRSVDDYPNDSNAVVWSKVEEYSTGARSNSWNYVEFAPNNYYNRAPMAYNWQIVNYEDNNIKAICGKAKGLSTAEALDRVYHSGDDGVTWCNDSVMYIPEDLSSSLTEFAFVADGVDSVWIICGGTGQVWRGRINRVAWKKEQDYFIE